MNKTGELASIAWDDMSPAQKDEWGRIMSGKLFRSSGTGETPPTKTPKVIDWNHRLQIFWQRMQKVKTTTPVPYYAVDISRDKVSDPSCGYAIIRHHRVTVLEDVGHIEAETTESELRALLRTCEIATPRSVVVSDHAKQLHKFSLRPWEDVIAAIKDSVSTKHLTLSGRPPFVAYASTPEAVLGQIRRRLYARAHTAARLVSIGKLTASDISPLSAVIRIGAEPPRKAWLEECAYAFWELDGRGHGNDVQHWQWAEAIVRANAVYLRLDPKKMAALHYPAFAYAR